jgi:hypothetical protein
MSKKVLTGVSNNITCNIDKIKVWANSFKKHVKDGEVVLIGADMDVQDRNILNLNGIKFHAVQSDKTMTINDSRLIHTANWIENSPYDLFMVTDVFDVCFQGDPFEQFDLDNYDFFAASEGLLHKEEGWNIDVITKAFPEYIDFIKPYEIICSGIMGGKKDILVKTLRKQQKLVNLSLKTHDIRDQAALNILIHTDSIERIKIFTPNEGWALHCALSGPTVEFNAWGLAEHHKKRYGLPLLEGNSLKNTNGLFYKIVHQYNRIPEWNEKITSEYV